MTPKIVAGVCIALSGMTGFATANPGPAAPVTSVSKPPKAAAAPTAVETLCGAGMQSDVTIDFENLRSVASRGRNRLSTDVVVRSNSLSAGRMAYAVEWFDDRGRPVRAAEIPAATRLDAKGSLRATHQTPGDLPDGFYELRIRAMSKGDDGTAAAAENRTYVRVDAGNVSPIDSDEWYALSKANEGVTP